MPYSANLRKALQNAANTVVEEDSQDTNKPDYECVAYRQMDEDVALVRTVVGGTKLMRVAGENLLPKHPNEEAVDYDRRLARAVLFNALAKTVNGLTGMVFRKDPVLSDDTPAMIVEHAKNIDLAGRDLSVFARDVYNDAMTDGHSWVMVDAPRVAEGEVVTLQQERERGLRPYWVQILKQDAINWRYELVDGRPVLTLFVYRELAMVPSGDFGEEVKERYRVLRPGSFELWEKVQSKTKTQWNLVDVGTTTIDYIPVVFVPTNRTSHFRSDPPLLDLAYENVEHWQVRSDHRHALMFASVPLPVFIGTEMEGVAWGPNRALFIDNPDASASILETSGSSIGESRQELKDIEARMAALGLQMLVLPSCLVPNHSRFCFGNF